MAVVIVASMALVSLTPSGALPDPCWMTAGVSSVGPRLCLNGATVAVANDVIVQAGIDYFEESAFIRFQAADQSWHVVYSRTGTQWSVPLPGGPDLEIRGPNDKLGVSSDSPYRMVALSTPMLPKWAEVLAARGVTVHGYLPVNHVLVHVQDMAMSLLDLPFVRAEFTLSPDSKIEPGLVAEGGTPLVQILAVPGGPGALDQTVEAVLGLGATEVVAHPELDRVTARLPAFQLRALAANGFVMWIDRAGEGFENDMDVIRVMVGADHIESVGGYDGAGIVGQVMDTGFDENHPDFAASLITVDGGSCSGTHGTSTYGVLFGSGAGDPQARGMAPGAQGVLACASSGQTRYQRAATLATTYGGVFQSNSWGKALPKDNSYDSNSRENDAIVFDHDVLVFQSMSNCGTQCARREAMAKNIISVGGIVTQNTADRSDDQWAPLGWIPASTGPADDGRIKPELIGPYDSIYTTTGANGYTAHFGGTSGATPVVAGSAALLFQMAKDGLFAGVPAGTLPSAAAAKALLVATADQYPTQQTLGSSRYALAPVLNADPFGRNIQGWGMPNLVTLHDLASGISVDDGTTPLTTGAAQTYSVTVPPGTNELRLSLTWTDVPANPAASTTLVNDLDLRVDTPGGFRYLGNFGLAQSPYSLPGGLPDRLNNLENIILEAPEPGTYTVTVTAAAVNLDGDLATSAVDQPYALVTALL